MQVASCFAVTLGLLIDHQFEPFSALICCHPSHHMLHWYAPISVFPHLSPVKDRGGGGGVDLIWPITMPQISGTWLRLILQGKKLQSPKGGIDLSIRSTLCLWDCTLIGALQSPYKVALNEGPASSLILSYILAWSMLAVSAIWITLGVIWLCG